MAVEVPDEGEGEVEVRHLRSRRRGGQLVELLVAQVAVVAAVVVSTVVLDQPLTPDRGLRQVDVLFLDEPVEGVRAVDGRPTLVVAAGIQEDPDCAREVRTALDRRGGPLGLDSDYALVILVPDPGPTLPAAPGTVVRRDPGGELARRLALPLAATSCRPGYAVVDPGGHVRYRTYDPGWGRHASEQHVLLGAVR